MGGIKCHKEMNIAFWHVVSSKYLTIFLGTNDSSCGSRIISASKHGKGRPPFKKTVKKGDIVRTGRGGGQPQFLF